MLQHEAAPSTWVDSSTSHNAPNSLSHVLLLYLPKLHLFVACPRRGWCTGTAQHQLRTAALARRDTLESSQPHADSVHAHTGKVRRLEINPARRMDAGRLGDGREEDYFRSARLGRAACDVLELGEAVTW